MQEYDTALKLLLRSSAKLTLQALTATAVGEWLDIELPKVQNLRADLIGVTTDECLIHLELQSSNDTSMALRMAEYCLGIFRLRHAFPRQILLYVGEAPLRMDVELKSPDLWFRYTAVDIRTLDGEVLLESPEIGDNVIAILARLRDHRAGIRRIVEKIAGLPKPDRESALAQLYILAGLRHLEESVEEETRNMPLDIDVRENKVLGREYKKGELAVLRALIEKKFGQLPDWAEERLTARTAAELEDLSVRILDAQSLEELLP